MSLSAVGNEKYASLPVLKGDEARDIDLKVTDQVGRIRILESVASRLADALHYHILQDASAIDTPLMFVAGKGNNGANAMAAARLLHFRGFNKISVVTLFDASTALRPNTQEQLDLLKTFLGEDKIFSLDFDKIQNFADGVLVDGVLGTGIADPPRGVSKQAIEAMNANDSSKVLSIDIPSGLNHISGDAPGVCVQATWTLNLHMFKSGQLQPHAKQFVGELWSAETALSFIYFPEGYREKFQSFYRSGPIQKVDTD
jgi:NAD(P)H-hydrate epimerase